MTKHIVVSFGRSAGITKGHQESFEFTKRLGDQLNADTHIHLSQTHDNKKNPLDHDTKIALAKQMMPHLSHLFRSDKDIKTPLDVLKKYSGAPGEHREIHFVAGSDRVEQYQQLFSQYNGKLYHFSKIHVRESGKRKEGISGTKLRELAANKEFDEFAKHIPSTAKREHAKQMFDQIRANLNPKLIKESMNKTIEQFLFEAKEIKKRASNKFRVNPDMSEYSEFKTHKETHVAQPLHVNKSGNVATGLHEEGCNCGKC